MTQESLPDKTGDRRDALRGRFVLNIRTKIVLPYLILTLAVAVIGVYVVTYLAASSLNERLTNHLLEAGRAVSDSLVRHELGHIESARAVIFTRGLDEALDERRADEALALSQPAAAAQGIECLILVDADGAEMVHLLKGADGTLETVSTGERAANLWIVQGLLAANDPEALPRRALGLHPIDGRYYYFTAIPVELEGRLIGVAVVGTRLDTLAARFKANSLANVIIYFDQGQIVAETLTVDEELESTDSILEQLSISPEQYAQQVDNPEITFGQDIQVRGRWYRMARGALLVGDETLGVFGVVLPSQFIIQAGTASRNTYFVLFAAAAVGVIVIGYLISRRITSPLARLVSTSKAVAEGELDRRTGIRSADEIGALAATFDEMTGRLEERTRELEHLLNVYKEASSRMRAILLSIGDGVVLEDLEGNFVPLNPAAETMLEQMAGEFRFDALHELSPAPDGSALESDAGPWLDERRQFQAGRHVFDIHSAPVRTDEGQHLGKVVVLRDVTVAAEAERLKDAFVSHVSHELRTPLTVIKGYSSLLTAQPAVALSDPQRAFIKSIDRNTDDLISMVEELLEFSEMEARGHLVIKPQPGDIGPLIEEVAERWQAQMAEKDLTLRVEIADHLPPVNVDLRRMRWAIVALVRNAWQYTPDGGTVTLSVTAQDGHLHVDVSDTGSGIRPEDMEQLFTRFYRSSSQDGNIRGLGLGLSLGRAIVEAHGGEMRVASEPGAGSTFSIILPALSPGSVTPSAPDEHPDE